MTWMTVWHSTEYHDLKQQEIDQVCGYLAMDPPQHILEIGCGLAQDSAHMQKQWHSHCCLIDVDRTEQDQRLRHKDWGSADSMQAYHTLQELDSAIQQQHPRFRYTLWNGRDLPRTELRFDLIYSNRSMGFHYPVSAYRDYIQTHSHPKTRMIVQLRPDRRPDHAIRVLHTIHSDALHGDICEIAWR
jgi:cyclopropane fatty-acyl-phospholipid synthase-like methyltransferase